MGSAEYGQQYIIPICLALMQAAHADPENQNVWINKANVNQVFTIDGHGTTTLQEIMITIGEFIGGLSRELSRVNQTNELREALGDTGLQDAIGLIPTQMFADPRLASNMKSGIVTHLHNVATSRELRQVVLPLPASDTSRRRRK
jgi:hypothetical protein